VAGELLPTTIEVGLLTVGILIAVGTLAKPLCSWLGLESYRNRIVGGPSSIDVLLRNDEWRQWAQELDSLGFRPLGVHEERIVPWPKTYQEDVFVSSDRHCLASLYSLFGDDWNVSLTSVMTDQTLVQTSTDGGDDLETRDCIMRRLPERPLQELFDAHIQSTDERVARGQKLTSHRTMEDAVDTQRLIFHNPTRHAEYRDAMKTLFIAKAKTIFCLPATLLVMWPFCQGHALIAEMFLVGSAVWMLAISLFFIGIDLMFSFARVRPLETNEQDAEVESSASIGGWLIHNHWLWLGALVALGWRFGGATSMVRTVLGAITILIAIEFLTRLLRFRRSFTPTSSD
jgi:hypothetical protein